MALVNVSNVIVHNNPTHFTAPFQFEVTFECIQELQDDLEWKVIYVGSAEDQSQDQVLEEVLVGPVPVGVNKFLLQADPPNPALIAEDDLIGVTVILITCSYLEREFVRIGYYVNNEYSEPFEGEFPPRPILPTQLTRHILADQPRVTRFPIEWSSNALPAEENSMQQFPLQYQDEKSSSMFGGFGYSNLSHPPLHLQAQNLFRAEEDDSMDLEALRS